uniref:trypsin n=1 Tax=Heliconius melpomene TaxID=34740 RepID=D9HQ78_HELME
MLVRFMSVVLLCGSFAQKVEDEPLYSGLLTPDCVKHYVRIVLTRDSPPRQYQYYHEHLAGLTKLDRGSEEDEVRWRIVGGKKITIYDAPYQVLFGKYCGGVLIAPEWVLTAAHCNIKEKYVYAGSTFRSDALGYRICAHFLHPFWNRTKLHTHDYDYQLALLEKPVPITSASRPIAIAQPSDIQPGIFVSITGWGYLKYKANRMQDVLHRIYIPLLSERECRNLPDGQYSQITERMFCAGFTNGTKDSCQGDSGSPVVYQGKLLGLVSYGIGCAEPNHPGVYANVPLARSWITSITGLPL